MTATAKQAYRDAAERARDNADHLRLAADHLRTAAALINTTVRDMLDNDEQRGLALTIAVDRDRTHALTREVARYADDERRRSAREAEKALPFELRP